MSDKSRKFTASATVSRRKFVQNAAFGAVVGVIGLPATAFGATPMNAIGRRRQGSGQPGKNPCVKLHASMADQLARKAEGQAHDPVAINHALKTSLCPGCGTRIQPVRELVAA